MIIAFLSTIALLVFFYYQDRNKEPLKVLIEAFLIGALISLQVDFFQNYIMMQSVFFQAFIVAGLIEEGVKLIALRYTLFRNPHFKEKVDGITYAVFLSLGFASIENILLITSPEVGIVRAFTATPAHALFGVSMGYYIGRYKFNRNFSLLLFALIIPTILHGTYNYLIMANIPFLLFLFIPYIIFLWVKGTIKISRLNKKVDDDND